MHTLCNVCFVILKRFNVSRTSAGYFATQSSECFQFAPASPKFRPNRVLVLSKMTRLEYERKLNPHMDNDRLKHYLHNKGSSYEGLLQHHNIHHGNLTHLVDILKKKNVDCRVLHRIDYNSIAIDWADAIFTAGGDGNFLLGASKIRSRWKPVIGVNTDPDKSEGFLCLPKTCTLSDSMDLLLGGRFSWLWRQRIRVTLSGVDYQEIDGVGSLTNRLQSMRLKYPENRWSEHQKEMEDAWLTRDPSSCGTKPSLRLPVLALNEVFVGESLSARVSYYEIGVDGGVMKKHKSSGVTICTGTGSTSWYFHINHLSDTQVREILNIAGKVSGHQDLITPTPEMIAGVKQAYNSAFVFNPADPLLGYAVRDPVSNSVFAASRVRGLASTLQLRSRMWDGQLVIDGDAAVSFNDGAVAHMEAHPEDALCCVQLIT